MEASVGKNTVAAAFQESAQAEKALSDLHAVGFTEEHIGLVVREDSEHINRAWIGEMQDQADTKAVEGVAAGGLIGGLLGAGLALAIPGIGTAIGAGIIATSIAGGAFAGGLAGPLASMGVEQEAADFLEDEFQAGSIIVTVQSEDRVQEAREILEKNGGVDRQSA